MFCSHFQDQLLQPHWHTQTLSISLPLPSFLSLSLSSVFSARIKTMLPSTQVCSSSMQSGFIIFGLKWKKFLVNDGGAGGEQAHQLSFLEDFILK